MNVLSHAVLFLLAMTMPADIALGRDTARPLNVMSWNIRYDNPRDGVNAWRHRRDWVGQLIVRKKVDIAGLQEVLKRQLNDLKSRLPTMASYGVGRDDGKLKGELVPIFYRKDRFELLAKSTFWLSKSPDKPGSRDWDAAITRIASWVKLKDRETGKTCYVINTHFDHRGPKARAESAALLVRKIRKSFSDHPVILMGDFNAMPDSTPIRTLTSAGKDKPLLRDARNHSKTKPVGTESTWNGFRKIVPKRRIDFVFVTRTIVVQAHQTVTEQRNGRFPSDHLPVLTKLVIEGREATDQ